MTPELLDAFARASAAARADGDIRALVVTGTGACFSAGADFKAGLQRGGDELAPHERSYAMYEPFLSLLDIEVPVIGALNGHAVGGGFGLALVCDIRIGALEGEVRRELRDAWASRPAWRSATCCRGSIGVARASELLFTGRLVDGAEAERLGILNRAVPAAQVMPRGDDARPRHRRQRPVRRARDEGGDPARPRPGGPRGRARRGPRSSGRA